MMSQSKKTVHKEAVEVAETVLAGFQDEMVKLQRDTDVVIATWKDLQLKMLKLQRDASAAAKAVKAAAQALEAKRK